MAIGAVIKLGGSVIIARKKRIWYPGAIYHIMSRGNHQQSIFRQSEDYKLFLQILRDVQLRWPFSIHAYCLMTNHFHMEIETLEKEIWHIMNRLLMLYAQNYNERYHCVGHLFQGRYKSLLIEDDNYFLETNRYIHMNPVKAGMVSKPVDYKYSSYSSYLSGKTNPILCTSKTLKYFRDSDTLLYQKFVEDALSHQESEKAIQSNLGENELWLPW